MRTHLIVLAKAPVPGRVKTRLCPPFTAAEAAALAAAALADTIATAGRIPVSRRILALDGEYPVPAGWTGRAQHGPDLGHRIVHAFAGSPGARTVLIGMDTPQVRGGDLTAAFRGLDAADAVLGLAADGGWWGLGLRDPRSAVALRDIPTSTSDTGALTLAALRDRGLRVAMLPVLRDVDTAADAAEVAALCAPGSAFAAAIQPYRSAGALQRSGKATTTAAAR